MINTRVRRAAIAVAATVTLAVSACSPPGGGGGGGGTFSDEARSAAEDLGINLDDCPTNPTEEFGPEVVLGNTTALTGGPAAAFAPLRSGVSAAINQLNADGDVPTTFSIQVKDDQYMPDRALAGVQELVEKDGAQAITNVLGSGQVLAVRPYLNDNCIPLVTATGNSSDSSDTTNFPWVVNAILQNPLDVRVWVEDAQARFPDGGKVAVLVANTESGKDYEEQIDRFLEGTNLELVETQTVEAAEAGAPSSQITTLRSSGADILFVAPVATQCSTALMEIRNQGWDPEIYMTNSCVVRSFIGPAGDAATGVHAANWYKDPTSPRWSDDPAVVAAVEAIKTLGDPAISEVNATAMSGYLIGEGVVRSIRAAADSPLGLSRLGLLVAAHHLDFESDLALPGIPVRLDGLKDQVAIESAYLQTWDATDGWSDGTLYEFEGQLTP